MVVSEQAGREDATVGGTGCNRRWHRLHPCAPSVSCGYIDQTCWQAEQEYRDTEQLVQTLGEYEAILRQVAGARPIA